MKKFKKITTITLLSMSLISSSLLSVTSSVFAESSVTPINSSITDNSINIDVLEKTIIDEISDLNPSNNESIVFNISSDDNSGKISVIYLGDRGIFINSSNKKPFFVSSNNFTYELNKYNKVVKNVIDDSGTGAFIGSFFFVLSSSLNDLFIPFGEHLSAENINLTKFNKEYKKTSTGSELIYTSSVDSKFQVIAEFDSNFNLVKLKDKNNSIEFNLTSSTLVKSNNLFSLIYDELEKESFNESQGIFSNIFVSQSDKDVLKNLNSYYLNKSNWKYEKIKNLTQAKAVVDKEFKAFQSLKNVKVLNKQTENLLFYLNNSISYSKNSSFDSYRSSLNKFNNGTKAIRSILKLVKTDSDKELLSSAEKMYDFDYVLINESFASNIKSKNLFNSYIFENETPRFVYDIISDSYDDKYDVYVELYETVKKEVANYNKIKDLIVTDEDKEIVKVLINNLNVNKTSFLAQKSAQSYLLKLEENLSGVDKEIYLKYKNLTKYDYVSLKNYISKYFKSKDSRDKLLSFNYSSADSKALSNIISSFIYDENINKIKLIKPKLEKIDYVSFDFESLLLEYEAYLKVKNLKFKTSDDKKLFEAVKKDIYFGTDHYKYSYLLEEYNSYLKKGGYKVFLKENKY